MVEKSSNTMDYSLLEPSISTVPVVPGLELVVGKFLADDVCAKFWEIESKISLSFNLHQFYEIQQDLFLAMTKYELGEVLDRAQFFTMWSFYEKFWVENLFTEALARKHLRLFDLFSTFKMGDIRGQIYLYYAECEELLYQRRGLRRLTEGRQVDWANYSLVMSQQFYNPGNEVVV